MPRVPARFAIALLLFVSSLRGDNEPRLVTFRSGDAPLRGWLYQPAGTGPFAAVLHNHGNEPMPTAFPDLATFWTDHGLVFFAPHRSGHGQSPGPVMRDELRRFSNADKDKEKFRDYVIKLHERANLDVIAALEWLQAQPFVAPNWIIMTGGSDGAIHVLLAAEKGVDVKAFLGFSPIAVSSNPVHERLRVAAERAVAPIFVLQAANDYNLDALHILEGILRRKGPPNRTKLYPAFGEKNDPADGHRFGTRGSDVWGADVLEFVRGVLPLK